MEKSKVLASKVQRYAVNVVAGGAALGVAMKDFGLVKKEVSDSTENLVERSIDKAMVTAIIMTYHLIMVQRLAVMIST